jgi:uncharacterized protein YbaR (Trm112 family)
MRNDKEYLDILVCPMDKGDLELTVEEAVGDEVIQGYFICKTCSERYPIEDRIPNFLPPEMRKAAT